MSRSRKVCLDQPMEAEGVDTNFQVGAASREGSDSETLCDAGVWAALAICTVLNSSAMALSGGSAQIAVLGFVHMSCAIWVFEVQLDAALAGVVAPASIRRSASRSWVVMLPCGHVAGLAQHARAPLAGRMSKVCGPSLAP